MFEIIQKTIDTYGINNIRISLYQDEKVGMFQNPLSGWNEYQIVSADASSLNLELSESYVDRHEHYVIGTMFEEILRNTFDRRKLSNNMIDQLDKIQVHVLVDDDNKYQKVVAKM